MLWLLVGWQFTLAEFAGGAIMIVLLGLLLPRICPGAWSRRRGTAWTGTRPATPGTAGTASPAGPVPRRPERRRPERRRPVLAQIRDRGAARLLRDRDRRGGTVPFPAAVTPAC